MRTRLKDEAVNAALETLPGWQLQDGQLTRTLTFPTFPDAIEFVGEVAAMAERANHHPDIDIRYNRLRFALSTHDSGGITHNDTAMAGEIERRFAAKG